MTREAYQDMINNITRAVRNEATTNNDIGQAENIPVAEAPPVQTPPGQGNQNLVRKMNTLTLESPILYYPNPIPTQWQQEQTDKAENPQLTGYNPPPLIMVDQVSALIEAAKMEMLEVSAEEFSATANILS